MSDDEHGVLRKHWRISLLVVLVLLSAAFLFLPTFAPDDGDEGEEGAQQQIETTGLTNLQFGLDLAGGSRVRAPLAGLTAEGLTIDPGETGEVEEAIATELDLSTRDVRAYHGDGGEGQGTIELRTDEVSTEEFEAALSTTGFEGGEIRYGVTEETTDEAVEVMQDKISESPFARGDASKATAADGQHFVVVEIPGVTLEEVIDLIGDQGVVELHITYPDGEGGYEERLLLEDDDIADVGFATEEGQQGPRVPVTLTNDGAVTFANAMRDEGFTTEGIQQGCAYQEDADEPGYCLLTVVDGEVVDAHSLGPDLAQGVESSEFESDPQFVMLAPSMDDARNLQINLRAGALPAPLDLDAGTQSFLGPSQAEEFKFLSLATGFVAVLAVSGVVAARYRDPRVGGPMIVTAASEVFLLLGFAALVGYPLDLAAIAGFIAVVGTGVDDLIIIADEILQEGDVSTGRVFESRFRKAFWVIGAAAATTIVAMSPLAVLSLGDLTGFALFTIVGVLIGVLVTRPAYGDILRVLLTGR
ncbi:preprotein translocase subunit SecD [Natronorarus salvus]|uniref:preprotein translocase subunit SecD n=1 Tax=Natronorarus salvus TaxID=3117733 RepID=UPI002F2631CE